MKGQSKRQSLVEAWVNILIGYSINLVAQAVLYPLYGFHITMQDNIVIGLIFTVISLVRSYGLRRVFNFIHVRQNEKRSLQAPQREAQ